MINVSAAPVVTAHHHANNCRPVDRDSAQPRIADYKLSDAFFIVTLGNLQTFDSLPELKRRLVIVDGEFPSNEWLLFSSKSICHVARSETFGYFPVRYEFTRW